MTETQGPTRADRARRSLWTVGAPARTILLVLIAAYRVLLSGWLGGQCRYYPTCSRYAEEAIRVHGALRGTALATWRVLRCGPFTRGGVDHVPLRRGSSTGRRIVDPLATQGDAEVA
jgi:putative membrane protein insertion efficiency factor